MELRLDFNRQEAHIVIGRPDYLQQVWILQTGGINTIRRKLIEPIHRMGGFRLPHRTRCES